MGRTKAGVETSNTYNTFPNINVVDIILEKCLSDQKASPVQSTVHLAWSQNCK